MKKDVVKTMKRAFALLGAGLMLLPANGWAEDVTATFVNVQLKSGQVESVMLSNHIDFVGPMIKKGERRVIVNGQSFQSDEVESITFEQRVVDGIETVNAGQRENLRPTGVFDLQGRRVQSETSVSASGTLVLPKGIYIVDGKKIVVK